MTATRFPDGYIEDGGVFRARDRVTEPGGRDAEATRIAAILAAASDLSSLSLELRRQAVDWPTQLHLAARRANLLRPFASQLTGRVLEVGAGCGALTRFLGETAREVVALEAGAERAAAARLRTRDQANVTIVCDWIEGIAFAERFDVVTLVGAQAYAQVAGAGGDYLPSVLNRLKGMLKPGGLLLLADDNRLGLKYFAGAIAAAGGKPFDGLNDLPAASGSASLGRRELAGRVAAAGFEDLRWCYPFPDFRLPTTILSETALAEVNGGDFTPLFAYSNFEDPLKPRPGAFSLEQAWTVVARNGLAEELANAFLVAARAPGGPAARPAKPARLAWHYSVDRHPAFAKEAVFEQGPKGALIVRRAPAADVAAPDGPVRLVLEDEPFFTGPLWSNELAQLLNNPGWTSDEVAAWLRFWINRLLAEAGIPPGANLMLTRVPGRFLDAMPFNLIIAADGASHFIDLEWEHEDSLSVLYLAYRALNKTLMRVTTCAAPAQDRHLLVNRLIKDVFRRVDLEIDVETMRRFEAEDRRLQNLARFGAYVGAPPGRLRMHLRVLKTRPDANDGLMARGLQLARRVLGK